MWGGGHVALAFGGLGEAAAILQKNFLEASSCKEPSAAGPCARPGSPTAS